MWCIARRNIALDGAVSDINSYANDLLIEFLDAAHDEIRSALQRAHGDRWLT